MTTPVSIWGFRGEQPEPASVGSRPWWSFASSWRRHWWDANDQVRRGTHPGAQSAEDEQNGNDPPQGRVVSKFGQPSDASPVGAFVQRYDGLLRRHDLHVDTELHIAVQADGHLVGAQRLEWLGQVDLTTLQRDASLLCDCVGDLGGTH